MCDREGKNKGIEADRVLARSGTITVSDPKPPGKQREFCFPGDQFIANSEYVEKLRSDYDAFACEMEGAAAAVVCLKYHTPFVVIRALSDKADGNAHESYENFGDQAANNSSRIVLKMLEIMG